MVSKQMVKKVLDEQTNRNVLIVTTNLPNEGKFNKNIIDKLPY